jgi:glycosyltransferase involved in cell wall biosynthesis
VKLMQVLTRGDVLGGAQSHVRELSLALLELGHDVTVVTGAPGAFTGQLQRDGIPSIQLRSLVRPVRPHRDFAALLELGRVMEQLKPDLVCAHTAKAGSLARAAARLHHIPSVFTPHGWSMCDRASLRPRPLYWCAERFAGRLGTRVINVCEYERGLAKQFSVCPLQTLEVVPNGIAECPLLRTRPVEAQPPTLIMVARFVPQKDHATLLQALAGLLGLPWQLLLVGDGELKESLVAHANALGLKRRVSFLASDANVNSLLLDAQIFVLSTNFEALPISILEAMRAGLPVVATKVGGIGEAVREGETGLLVGHREVDELRLALARLITQADLRTRMGVAAQRLWASEFTARAMAARTTEVYQRAVAEFVKDRRSLHSASLRSG